MDGAARIVAGATASAFGLQLAGAGIAGADKILPIVFVVVFGTVVVYGLTGMPVARWLGVAGAEGTLVLIVGGHEAARAVGAALKRACVGVRLWASPSTHAAARSALRSSAPALACACGPAHRRTRRRGQPASTPIAAGCWSTRSAAKPSSRRSPMPC